MAKFRVRGGDKLAAYLRAARHTSPIKMVEVGFFQTARYPDGTPVTSVALWNELGTRPRRGSRGRKRTRQWHSVPRPFMRRATPGIRRRVRLVLKQAVRSGQPFKIDRTLASLVGLAAQAEIIQSINTFRNPGNRPATIKRKGSSHPLIDTGTMKQATTFKVIPK